MPAFTKKEIAFLRKLNTPAKVQDFLNQIPANFETNKKETIKSPLVVLRANSAHCFEGALLGAYILSLQGFPPLLVSLEAAQSDVDHVIAPFKQQGLWGALSKTNHAVLRYREPIYRSLRELAMSYFHEYFTDLGTKTLIKYSRPLNLNSLKLDWVKATNDLWAIDEALDKTKYYDIAPARVLRKLRRADKLERQAGKLTEWKIKNKHI